MKKFLCLTALIGLHTFAFAQGMMLWNNTFATLISDGNTGGPMPFRVSPQTTYYFGLFIAPYGTPPPLPGFAGINDPNWQNVVSYTMNSTASSGAGRMANPGTTTISGYSPGETVSFVIRGWNSSAGGADWAAVKPWLLPDNYGQSELGFVLLGGGAFPIPSAFGTAYSPPSYKEVSGFVIGVPEPSSLTLAGLGAAVSLIFRRKTRVLHRSNKMLRTSLV